MTHAHEGRPRVTSGCRPARRVWSLDHIRGKSVGEALATLQYTPEAAARLIEKVLRSAIANAEHNHQVRNLDDLRVSRRWPTAGPSLKRCPAAGDGPGVLHQAPD